MPRNNVFDGTPISPKISASIQKDYTATTHVSLSAIWKPKNGRNTDFGKRFPPALKDIGNALLRELPEHGLRKLERDLADIRDEQEEGETLDNAETDEKESLKESAIEAIPRIFRADVKSDGNAQEQWSPVPDLVRAFFYEGDHSMSLIAGLADNIGRAERFFNHIHQEIVSALDVLDNTNDDEVAKRNDAWKVLNEQGRGFLEESLEVYLAQRYYHKISQHVAECVVDPECVEAAAKNLADALIYQTGDDWEKFKNAYYALLPNDCLDYDWFVAKRDDLHNHFNRMELFPPHDQRRFVAYFRGFLVELFGRGAPLLGYWTGDGGIIAQKTRDVFAADTIESAKTAIGAWLSLFPDERASRPFLDMYLTKILPKLKAVDTPNFRNLQGSEAMFRQHGVGQFGVIAREYFCSLGLRVRSV